MKTEALGCGWDFYDLAFENELPLPQPEGAMIKKACKTKDRLQGLLGPFGPKIPKMSERKVPPPPESLDRVLPTIWRVSGTVFPRLSRDESGDLS